MKRMASGKGLHRPEKMCPAAVDAADGAKALLVGSVDNRNSSLSGSSERKWGIVPVGTFSLHAGQVPEPPRSNLWVDQLRWLICVMNPDDRALHFISSVYAWLLKHGGLTSPQAKVAQSVLDRVRTDFDLGHLHAQILVPGYDEEWSGA